MIGLIRGLIFLVLRSPVWLWVNKKGVLALIVFPGVLIWYLSQRVKAHDPEWPAPSLLTVGLSCAAALALVFLWLVAAHKIERQNARWWSTPLMLGGAAAAALGMVALAPNAASGSGVGFAPWGFLALGFMVTAIAAPLVWALRELTLSTVRGAVAVKNRLRPPAQGAAAMPAAAAPGFVSADGKELSVAAPVPGRTLESIAGMVALKADLAPVLAPFRAWTAGTPTVPDRNGILFSGPPGNGKTTFAEAIAGELRLPFLKIGVDDLTSKWVNETAEKIAAIVDEALAHAPCVLFIDEIDAVAPRRDGGPNVHQEDKKTVNTLLQQIDRLRRHPILLIGATNYMENIDPAVIRDGRFDFRIEIPWPDEPARLGMLNAMAAKRGVVIPADIAAKFAKRWERRSAAFIENVVKRARDLVPAGTPLTAAQLRQCDRAVSKRAGNLPGAGPKLSELYLLPQIRRDAESIAARLAHWDDIADQGGTPPRGVLLYGPPGTGKTMLIGALARELGDWHVFEVRTSEILADPREFKKVIELATAHRPAFIFIDEADDLLRDRNASYNANATNEILKAMDGAMGAIPEVVFVAATNNAEAIDAAAKRSGRFSEKLFLDLMRDADLVEFIRHQIAAKAKLQLAPTVTAEDIAAALGEAGPADVVGVLNMAVNATFGAGGVRRQVELEDIHQAVAQLRAV